MADPKIKYDIEAEAHGGPEVERLAKTLEDLGATLDVDVKRSADAAAVALREMAAKTVAAQEFTRLKREAVDLGSALDKATQSVETLGRELPEAAATTRQFADAEKAVRDAIATTEKELRNQRQALVDLRSGSDAAKRGTDEYKASVAQAVQTITGLRGALSQKREELRQASESTKTATKAERELAQSYQQAINTARDVSRGYAEKNRALDQARQSARALGAETLNLRQSEQALAAGMQQARDQIASLVQSQQQAKDAARAQAHEELRLASIVQESRRAMEAAARAEADGILRDAERVSASRKAAAAESQAAATAAAEAGKRVQQAFGTLGVRSVADLKGEIAQVRAALQTVETSSGLTGKALQQAMAGGQDKLKSLQRELRAAQGELTLTDRAAGLFGSTLGKIAGGNVAAMAVSFLSGKAAELGKAFVVANLQMEGLRRGLNAVYKDSNTTASQIDFLRETASRAGVSAGGLADSFKSFAASTQAANIPLGVTNELFAGVTQAGAALGLSGERVGLVLQALGQMAAKGVVSMEELRQQLGESLPGAMTMAAKGLGLTEAELIKLVESGKLAARDLFPALAKSMKELQGDTTGLINTWERFKNAMTMAAQNAGDAGGMQIMTMAVKALGVVVGVVTLSLNALMEVINGVLKGIGVLVGAIVTLTNPLKELGAIVTDAAQRQSKLTDAFDEMTGATQSAGSAQQSYGQSVQDASAKSAAASAGVTSLGQAHTDAATAAQNNATAQTGASLAAKIAGDQALDAGAKYVQLGLRLGELAQQQDQAAKNAEKMAAAAKIEGESLVMLAGLRGNEIEQLRVAAEAAEKNAEATEKVAQAREAHLATLQAELKTKLDLIGADEAQKKAREVELKEIQKKIDALTAESAASRAAADASKIESAQRRIALDAYRESARSIGELRLAMEKSIEAARAVEDKFRQGLATQQEVKKALIASAEAQAFYNNELERSIAVAGRSVATLQSKHQLEQAGLDLKMAEAKAQEQKAIRDGNEYQAAQARIRQKEIEIAMAKAKVAAIEAESKAESIALDKRFDALPLEGKLREEKVAEIANARRAVEVRMLEAKAIGESTKELERQLRVLKGYEKDARSAADANQKFAASFQNLSGSAGGQSEAMDKLMMRYTMSAQYSENQIKILEREAAAVEKLAEAYRKRWNIDKEGYSLNTAGQRVMDGETQDQVDKDVARRYGDQYVGNADANRARQLARMEQHRGRLGGLIKDPSTSRQIAADRRERQEIEARLMNNAGPPQPNKPEKPANTINIHIPGFQTATVTADADNARLLETILRELGQSKRAAGV